MPQRGVIYRYSRKLQKASMEKTVKSSTSKKTVKVPSPVAIPHLKTPKAIKTPKAKPLKPVKLSAPHVSVGKEKTVTVKRRSAKAVFPQLEPPKIKSRGRRHK
jgi:hypothetical protein